MNVLRATLIFGAFASAGCASIPKDAGFGSVRDTVWDRIGHRVQWDRDAAADRDVEQAVHRMLQNDLTADGAVQVALLNNQHLQATYEELGIAQAEVVEAGLIRNPELSAEVRFPSRPALPYEIDVMQSFLDLLLLPVRKRAAGAAFESAKLRVTSEVLDTAAEVKAAYYRAQGALQLVEMRRQIAQATEASLDVARRQHEAGNITDLALADHRALHEQARVDLAQAEAAALDAREELNALMGVWGPDTQWKLTPRLPDLPRAEIDPHALEALAIGRRTDLAAAREDVQVAASKLGLTRAWPLGSDMTLGAHVEKDTDGALTVGPAVTVPLPIFNQGQPAIAAAQARLRQSRRRYLAQAVEVRAQVRRTRTRMIASRQRAEYFSAVILPLRHQIVQQTQLQYNAMLVGVFQLLQVKQNEIDAGREYVQALQDYWVARADLERAIGGRLETTTGSTRPTTLAAGPQSQPTEPDPQQHHHQTENNP